MRRVRVTTELGLGARPDVDAPSVDDLRWGDDEIADMFDPPVFPR